MGGLLSSNNDEYKAPPHYTDYQYEAYNYNRSAYSNVRTEYNPSAHLSTNRVNTTNPHLESASTSRVNTTNPRLGSGYVSGSRGENTLARVERGYGSATQSASTSHTNPRLESGYSSTRSQSATIGGARKMQCARNNAGLDELELRFAESCSILRDSEPAIDSWLMGLEVKLGRRIQSRALSANAPTASSSVSYNNYRSKDEQKTFPERKEKIIAPTASSSASFCNHRLTKEPKTFKRFLEREEIVIKDIFLHIYPQDNDYLFNMVQCDEDSAIFKRICKNQGAFFNPRRTLKVLQVFEVKNIHLKALYQLKKADFYNIYGSPAIERNMFHCSSYENCCAICMENFDYRLNGTSKGHKYGQGISFSPKFCYANYFSDKMSSVKTMLQCKVLYSNAHVGDNNTVVPKDGFDSTKRENGRVIVKYDDDVFLPEYFIRYTLT